MDMQLLAKIQDNITLAQLTGVSVLHQLAKQFAFDQAALMLIDSLIESEES